MSACWCRHHAEAEDFNEGDIKKAVAAFKMLLLFTCLNLAAEIPSL